VVLVGSGHVVYDLGIQRQAAKWSDVAIASVIPIPVRTADHEDIETVRASYADFVWGLPPDTDPLYPTLGISTRKAPENNRRTVIYVAEDSVGERAGLAVGDTLLAMDGEDLSNKESLSERVAQKRWGDTATVKVQRGNETLELEVAFRRERPGKDDEEHPE
jgi:S1-C subfamily serine protease